MRDVATQPPWSIAMSTITDPGRIEATISSDTITGAFAPGSRTLPITASASRTRCSSVSRSDISVTILPR